MKLQVEDPEVGRILAATAELIHAHGGILHPALCIHQAGPSLWISLAPGGEPAPDVPLLQVPSALLVPVDGLSWPGEGWAPVQGLDALSAPQQAMYALLVALYELTGKLAHARRHLPRLALPPSGAVAAWLASAWPAWASLASHPVEAFNASRVLNWPHPAGTVSPGAGARLMVLMPLIDLINHHPAGARFDTGAPDHLRVAAVTSGPDRACYARYGRRDAMELLLYYGYASTQPRHVCPPSCELALPGLGAMRILGQGGNGHRDLPAFRRVDGVLELAFFTLDADQPARDRQRMSLFVRALQPGLREAALEAAVTRTLQALISEAGRRYEALAQAVAGHDPADGTPEVLADFSAVAAHQLALLAELRRLHG